MYKLILAAVLHIIKTFLRQLLLDLTCLHFQLFFQKQQNPINMGTEIHESFRALYLDRYAILSSKGKVVVMGRTVFDVRCPFIRRQKLGVRVRLLRDEHVQCPFDVQSTVR